MFATKVKTVAIFIPSKDKHGNGILYETRHTWEGYVVRVFCKLFGGATAIPACGYWQSGKTPQYEETTVLFSFVPLEVASEKAKKSIFHLAEHLALALNQETVLFCWGGEAYFVKPSALAPPASYQSPPF